MENNNFKPFPFEQLKQKKEPEKTAVAIAYEPGEKAPKILATGKGQVAEKLLKKQKRVRFRLTKTINLRLPFQIADRGHDSAGAV